MDYHVRKEAGRSMGMPEVPDIKPRIDVKKEDVINLLLLSIALEEISLAHIINAEAEKLQEVLDKNCKLDDLLEVNEAVTKALRTVIKKEILLQFKFENVLELIKDKKKRCE
jgi:hypothetical protein